jgi:ABC-2 type transport system ATP-binding protein
LSDNDVVIRISDVSKRFVLRKEKSLKERIVNFGRSNLHKDDFYALNGVTLDIRRGSTVGLIGPNGSGKSTLLKTIGGIIQPTTGTVMRRGRLAALLELGAGFHPDLTGRENVYLNAAILGLSKEETDARFDDIVDFSGIEKFIDTQVKFYSSGMYVRLAFAVAVHVDPEILIVDEVLAVGDEPFQRKCMDRIRAFQREGKTIVLVTHSLDLVVDLCDRAVVLESGVVKFDGEPAEALHVLREDFEQIRQNEEAVTSPEIVRFPVRIERAILRKKGESEAASIIDSGSDLELSVTVSSEAPIANVMIGMGIENGGGLLIFGTNNDLLKVPIDHLQGSATATFSLPNLNLGAGQYFFHASVGTLDVGELSRIPRAGSFQVDEPSSNPGLLSVQATVALISVRGPEAARSVS